MTEIIGKRERNKAANRAEILAAGSKCFAEHGYEAITVRDIIRGTTLATGTFYNYFPDKQSVLHALIESRVDDLTRRLSAIRRNADNLRDFIYDTYLTTFQTIIDDPLFYQVILRNIPAVQELLDDSIMGISVAALENDIRDAVDRRLIPEVDVPFLAAAFFGVAHEFGRMLVRRGDRDPKPAAEMATRLFLHGVTGSNDTQKKAVA